MLSVDTFTGTIFSVTAVVTWPVVVAKRGRRGPAAELGDPSAVGPSPSLVEELSPLGFDGWKMLDERTRKIDITNTRLITQEVTRKHLTSSYIILPFWDLKIEQETSMAHHRSPKNTSKRLPGPAGGVAAESLRLGGPGGSDPHADGPGLQAGRVLWRWTACFFWGGNRQKMMNKLAN